MDQAIKRNNARAFWGGFVILLVAVFLAVCGRTGASELTDGKKALFSEDFEMDIYEWVLMEEGEKKGEDPDLITTKEAYQGRNALLLSGRKGILGIKLIERVKGLVEFQVKFPAPHNYTRMFAVGLGEEELLLGVNRSENFAYAIGGVWQTAQVPVDEGWHTFTYDFSGAVTRAYIDGKLITTAPQLHEFDGLRLGVNGGRGGRCLVDEVVIYAGEAELSESWPQNYHNPLRTEGTASATVFHTPAGTRQRFRMGRWTQASSSP